MMGHFNPLSHADLTSLLGQEKGTCIAGGKSTMPRGVASFEGLPAFGLLHHAAEQIPDRTAVIDGERRWSYGDLDRDAIAAAAMLQRLGVKPGDRVGILLPNVTEYIISANAIWRAGAVAIAISPLMVASEVQDLLAKTGCRHVICLDMLSQLVDESSNPDVSLLLVSIRQHLPSLQQLGYLWMRHGRTGHWSLPEDQRTRWFWNEIEKTTNQWQPISIDSHWAPAYILPTGGTTGAPKAVTLSHANMVANAWQQYQWTDRSFGEETMLAVLPFFHSYGMSATIMGGAAMGATLVLHHRFSTRQTISLLEQHEPSVFHAVPAMLVAMNDRFRKVALKTDSLRWVISGGASLEESIGSEFSEHTGALVVEGYGLSEAGPVTHVGPLFDRPSFGTIGLPLPMTQCRLVEPTDGVTPVGDEAVGELVVRGPQVMLGYWGDPEATRQAIQDGWLHTGDLATKDSRGFYRIVGRKKDLIITSGFNVYPGEVEKTLREAAGVLDAAVVGAPDPRRGEIVKAFIVMESSAAWDESALQQHCAQRLSKYKRPQIYELCVGDLPRNFLGKVIRRELRETTNHETLEVAS